MENFDVKVRLIFVPFLKIAALTIVFYTFAHWFFCIYTSTFVVDEQVTNFFIPFVLPLIPILIWLRPCIKLLDLKKTVRGKDPIVGFILFAWFAMIAPMIIAQEFLISASGELTALNTMSQVSKLPPTKYYTVKHYFVDTRLAQSHSFFTTSGKHNQNYDMSIYCPSPVFDEDHTLDTIPAWFRYPDQDLLVVINGKVHQPGVLARVGKSDIKSEAVIRDRDTAAKYGDATKNGVLKVVLADDYNTEKLDKSLDGNAFGRPSAWVSIRYFKTIRNSSTREEKDEAFKELADDATADLKRKSGERFVYLNRLGINAESKHDIQAIKANSKIPGPYLIFEAVNQPFSQRNGLKLVWFFVSFAIGALVFMLLLLRRPLKEAQKSIYNY